MKTKINFGAIVKYGGDGFYFLCNLKQKLTKKHFVIQFQTSLNSNIFSKTHKQYEKHFLG